MNRYKQIILLALSVVLLAGCSSWPAQTKAPTPPVTAADAASAIMAADVAINNAKQRKNLWRDTTNTLDKADNAMAADEYREARDLANTARGQAEVAVLQSYREEALFLITSLRKGYIDQMVTDQKTRLESAESAWKEDRVKLAYDIASIIMAELQAQMDAEIEAPVINEDEIPVIAEQAMPEPVSMAQMSVYIVSSKDNLWGIAAKPEVYGNSDMWPLLWKANKDKIKKPDNIASGLSLVIDRSASSESVAAAIKYSKLRGASSLGPVDAFDQQYLNK